MRVLKFGGSTLKNVSGLQGLAGVVRAASQAEPIVVVVSALYGVTDQLIELIAHAEAGNRAAVRAGLRKCKSLHAKRQAECKISEDLEDLFSELSKLCEGVLQLGECSARTRDRILGFGELLSATLVAAVLRTAKVKADFCDAREIIVTDDNYGSASVDRAATKKRVAAILPQWKKRVPVVTGFIAATRDGVPTTVGRNGSDYTAALLGAVIKAKEIEIWSDVNGVLSADPRIVPEAFPLPSLSYAEAMELAYFGAKVLHPRAVIPAIDAKVPMRMRNLFDLDFPGTVISARTATEKHPVKGITAIPDMSLLSLEGAGMIGVVGVSERLFGTLARHNINVAMISQGSSEQSICVAVKRCDVVAATEAIRETFEYEFRTKRIRRLQCREKIAVIAVVGKGMQGTPGIAARLFTSLSKNTINVVAVAQGSSEQNISLVIDEHDCAKALNVIHGAFHLARRRVHVVVVGKGTIGSKLLEQINEGQKRLLEERDLCVRVVGIVDSKRYLFKPEGLNLSTWKTSLKKCKTQSDLTNLGEQLSESRLENIIIVDATASEHPAQKYTDWLSRGFSVCTPNKKACTMNQAYYDTMMQQVRDRRAHFLYETCVGAGLPVISTLQDLVDSGDRILHIDAMLSGTLGYVFSELETGKSFSEIVKTAHSIGYTEPDPRDDLSGMDVARKLHILARKCGQRLALSQVSVEPLVSKKLMAAKSVKEFFATLPEIDAEYAAKVAAAAKQGKVLRYVGRVKGRTCKVALTAVPKDSPFGSLQGGDNLVVFTSERYSDNPLIVRGPGAGPDVTAGGVFADILKIAHLLTSD